MQTPRAGIQALIGFLLLGTLLACSGGRSAVPAIERLADGATILAFGDSLTYGTGARREQAYPARLADLSGHPVINAGVPGETTDQGLQRLSGVLDQTQPQLVILCLGGNDMLRKRNRDQMASNLETMIAEIRRRGISVVMLAVPEPKLIGLSAEPRYEALAERLSVPLERKIIAEVLSDRDTKSDSIHPNAAGYALIAAAVHSLLRQSGALAPG